MMAVIVFILQQGAPFKINFLVFFCKRRDLRKTVKRQNSSRGRKLKAGFVPSSSAKLFGNAFQILRPL